MKMIIAVLIPAIAMLFSVSVKAESIRCGSHVIEDGGIHKKVTMEEVVKKCGQPSSREVSRLYYKKKGKRLDFDTEGRLMSISEIEEDQSS